MVADVAKLVKFVSISETKICTKYKTIALQKDSIFFLLHFDCIDFYNVMSSMGIFDISKINVRSGSLVECINCTLLITVCYAFT